MGKKHEPTASRGAHHKFDAGEQSGQGSTGPEVKGKGVSKAGDYGTEYDENGNEKKGGGYYKKAGKLCKMAKSGVTEDDLQKSLDRLADFADAGDQENRREVLLNKALAEDITAEENAELISIMGGVEPVEKSESLADQVTEPLGGDELQKSLDVSDYLAQNHEAMVKSLGLIADAVERTDNRQHEFGMLLSKAVRAIGQAVQANRETLDALVNQSAGPKSQFRPGQSGVKPLEKSFGGQPPAEEQLTKAQVFDVLESLMRKSVSNGMGGRLPTGEDLNVEITKFESTGSLSPNALRAVKESVGKAAH